MKPGSDYLLYARHPRSESERRFRGKLVQQTPYADHAGSSPAAGSADRPETLVAQPRRQAGKRPLAHGEACEMGMTAGNKFSWSERHKRMHRRRPDRETARLARSPRIEIVCCLFAFRGNRFACVSSPTQLLTNRNYRIATGFAIRFLRSNWISTAFRLGAKMAFKSLQTACLRRVTS